MGRSLKGFCSATIPFLSRFTDANPLPDVHGSPGPNHSHPLRSAGLPT